MCASGATFRTKILLIGAGELGLAILHSLLSHPSEPSVSILLRTSSKTDLAAFPVRVVHGDISSSVHELASLFEGYDIVISATGFASGPGSQLKLAQAALEAKIPHYVPWQFGVDYDVIGRGSSQPLFDEQLDVRDLLRSQAIKGKPSSETEEGGTRWTIISTGIFTSFLFDPSFDVVKLPQSDAASSTLSVGEDGDSLSPVVATVRALGSWDNRLTITSASDIGRMTSRILLDSDSPEEGVIFIAGDTITFSDVAQAVEDQGWSVDRKLASIGELEETLRKNPEDVGAKYSLIWARGRGVAWDVEGSYNESKGYKLETLAEWVMKNIRKP